MPNFNRGDVLSLNLAANDTITFSGTANIVYTPTGGSSYSGYITGINQTIGPFNLTNSLYITCDTAGSYTINSSKVLAFTSRTLTSADDGKTFIPSDSSQTATIPPGLISGLGCAFNNDITVSAGSGVTVTDKRISGAINPTCAIVNTGTNVYELWGSKS